MHKGLDLLLDVIEVTTDDYLSTTGEAIESFSELLKKYCVILMMMEEHKNA